MINNFNINKESKGVIKSFLDLRAYQNLYTAMLCAMTKIAPSLPNYEKYDLADQIRRASKAAPALLAEGFAKRYQKRNWAKYLNDTLGESNEMIHHLSVCIDVYSQYVDVELCRKIISTYDIACRQITNLKKTWQNFHDRSIN